MSVCLNMIVRDEAAVIARCLASVRPWIDSWCIIDTGSVDRTREIILQSMVGLSGELLDRPWVRQDHNRNEALETARRWADHVLLIDADEVLEAEPGFVLPELKADVHEITVRYASLEFARPMIVRSSVPFRWVGRRHPYLGAGQHPVLRAHLYGLRNIARAQGASWRDPQKYQRHIEELEADVAADPDNPRLRYYLAQTYRDTGRLGSALQMYQMRAQQLRGFIEETWSALYEAAKLLERLHRPYNEVLAGYLRAFRFRPTRAEPLVALARYLRHRGDFTLARCFAREAATMPRPPDRLFVEWQIYEGGAAAEVRLLDVHLGEPETEPRVWSTRPSVDTQGEMQC